MWPFPGTRRPTAAHSLCTRRASRAAIRISERAATAGFAAMLASRPRRHFNIHNKETQLSFFENIHETQITRNYRQPALTPSVPLHRRLLPIAQSAGDIARAAVREVLG
jgi:hypothetical protein